VTCLAYSRDESTAFDYLREELPEEYSVWTDSFGNLFATRDPDFNRALFVGSHLDTVHQGGRFDGRLGVVVALEAIEAVYESSQSPALPIVLAVFRGEEASRFDVGTIGSRAALGMLSEHHLETTDESGISLREAMERVGCEPQSGLAEPSLEFDRIVGFVETHIEQGPVLAKTGSAVGVVSEIRGPVRHRVTVTGTPGHSGATPMDMRSDAVAGAGKMVAAVQEVATEMSREEDVVATVGKIHSHQGAINKVCDRVSFTLDVRSTDPAHRARTNRHIEARLNEIATSEGLSIDMVYLDSTQPVSLDPRLTSLLEESAQNVGTSYETLPSGGGHDAMNFAIQEIPAAMLFTPSPNGISHNPAEDTDYDAVKQVTACLAWGMANFEL
jgi:hydantoinase/carbamoylase family amidase